MCVQVEKAAEDKRLRIIAEGEVALHAAANLRIKAEVIVLQAAMKTTEDLRLQAEAEAISKAAENSRITAEAEAALRTERVRLQTEAAVEVAVAR